MTTHTINGRLFVMVCCPGCGTEYLVPQELSDAAMRVRDKYDKGSRPLYCPDGHCWHFTRPDEDSRMASSRKEIERLAEKLVATEEKLAAAEALVKQLGGNVTAFPGART